MDFDVNKINLNLNQTFLNNKKNDESQIEIIDNFIEFSNSDSNYVSENSTIDLNNENEIDKSLIDLSEIKTHSENWLFDDFESENNHFLLDFNFSTMKIDVKINNKRSLLEKLLINLSLKENYAVKPDEISFSDRFYSKMSSPDRFNSKIRITTSTPICKKVSPFIKIDDGAETRGSTEILTSSPHSSSNINNKTVVLSKVNQEKTFINVNLDNTFLKNSFKYDLESSSSDKTMTDTVRSSIKEISPHKINDKTIIISSQRSYLNSPETIRLSTDSLDEASDNSLQDPPSLPISTIDYSRRMTQPLIPMFKCELESFASDKTMTKTVLSSLQEISPTKINDKTIIISSQRSYLNSPETIRLSTDSLDEASDNSLRDLPSLPLSTIDFSRRMTQPLIKPLIPIQQILIKDVESLPSTNSSHENTESGSPCSNRTTNRDISPPLSTSSSDKPQSRLSKLRQTFPKTSAVSSSTTNLTSKRNLQKPNAIKSVFEPLLENKQSKRHSVVLRPKGKLSVQPGTVRQSIAVFPSSNIGQNKTEFSKNEKSKLSKFPLGMTAPLNSVTNDLTKTDSITSNKPNQRIVVPTKIFKKSNLASEPKQAQKLTYNPTESNIPQKTIIRPSQLKYNNSNMKFPRHSDSVPLMSPMNSADDNPLNRTFDKQDFLLLKSVTNTNQNTILSVTDTCNNNNTVYNIAQAEEQKLIKELRLQSVAPRGLKLPSKIQSRAIPSLKR